MRSSEATQIVGERRMSAVGCDVTFVDHSQFLLHTNSHIHMYVLIFIKYVRVYETQ